ncbi:MAG: right-handed parallel beta-helix repeat-containing protein, partial [Clostridia bacterium]|nr:right-handed parallel beta-helix repeat-containing protein [Clostridia bacterium]
ADIATATNDFKVPSNKTVVLDLDGHYIDRPSGCDIICIKLEKNSNLTLSNGTIKGGRNFDCLYQTYTGYGGGIFVSEGATCTMNNCTVEGCHAINGGGVMVDKGTLIMNDSNISTNYARYNGAGLALFNGATCIMNGGSIDNNLSQCGTVCGVYMKYGENTFTMNDGFIVMNSTVDNPEYCVYMNGGSTFNINGGKIFANDGGIYYAPNSTFNISGEVKIEGNSINNVYMADDRNLRIHVTGDLASDSLIHVYHPDAQYPEYYHYIATVADGVKTPVVHNFVSDRHSYVVYENPGVQQVRFYTYDDEQQNIQINFCTNGFYAIQNGVERTSSFNAVGTECIQFVVPEGKRITSFAIKTSTFQVVDCYYYINCRTVAARVGRYGFSNDCDVYVEMEDFTVTHYEATDPTCTEPGHKEYWTGVANQTYYYDKKECLEPVEASSLITSPALGHDIVHHNAQAPTCIAVGCKAYDTCSRCDYTTYQSLPIIDHNYENGVCTMCGKGINEVDSWAELQARITAADSGTTISLRQDVTAEAGDTALTFPAKTLVLNLNGHTIDRGLTSASACADGSVMTLAQEAILTISNASMGNNYSITGGNTTGNGGGIYVGPSARLTLNNVALVYNNALNGGGIYVDENATLTLNGSYCVAGYASDDGGGIYVNGGSVTLNDSIFATNAGLGDNAIGSGAVHLAGGSLTMSGGEISECTGRMAGGVYVDGGTFTMSDNATLRINAGSMFNDSVGGVYVNSGTFTMAGGLIERNESVGIGGVYVADGATFNMTGGTITGNEGYVCGGVNNDGTFNLSGSVTINNNVDSNSAPSDVYANNINITGALDSSSRIGIKAKTAVTNLNPRLSLTNGFTGRATVNNFFCNDAADCAIRVIGGELALRLIEGVIVTGSGYTLTGFDGEHTTDFTAAVDDEITLTAPEDKKLVVTSIRRTTQMSAEIDRTQVNCRNYTFTMPVGDVVVDASTIDFIVAHVPAADPTCTEDGNYEHWTGNDGNNTYYYNDERCRDEDQVTVVAVTRVAFGHNYENNVCTHCHKLMGVITSWADLQYFFTNADDYNEAYLDNYIYANVSGEDPDTMLSVPAGKAVTLDLKGYTIDRSLRYSEAKNDGSVIKVGEGASLTINSSSDDYGVITGGNAKLFGGGIYVDSGAVLTLNNVNVYGNKTGMYGGGIYSDYGRVFMYDSTISNNNGYKGAGVFCQGSEFRMENCVINDNTSSSGGEAAGVYCINSEFMMIHGQIKDNRGDCGVCIKSGGIFTISGGEIIRNINTVQSEYVCGGVYVESGTLTINNGIIAENTGCGVYYKSGTINVSGTVIIKDNTLHNYNDTKSDFRWAAHTTTPIVIAGELSETASIGVYNTHDDIVTLTSGLNGNGGAYNFFCNGEDRIRINAAGEAELYAPSSSQTLTLKLAADSDGSYNALINGTEYACTTASGNAVAAQEGETIYLYCDSNKRFVEINGYDTINKIDYKQVSFVMPASDVTLTVTMQVFVTVTYHPEIAPTCTDFGFEEYWTGKTADNTTVFFNNNGTLPGIPSIPMSGHDFIHHDAQAVTCTAVGWEAYDTCSRCNYTTYEEIPATGHTEVTDAAVAPTCATTGLTQGKHCSVCNEVLVAQEEIAALGHNYVNDVCTRCDKNKYDVTSWAELQTLFDEENNFSARLINDIAAGDDDTTLTVPSYKTVTLDLNGFTIDRNPTGNAPTSECNVIETGIGTDLTINDSSAGHTGQITGSFAYGNAVFVNYGATFTMNGGSITGNTGAYGTVKVAEGTFIMNGGSITGNTNADHGGVSVYRGTFTMNGGSIADNVGNVDNAKSSGGVGLDESSIFVMNGGSITGNTGTYGGVRALSDSCFIMNGGTITGNTGTYGGVYVEGEDYGEFEISGNVNITGNTGGNVVIDETTRLVCASLLSTSSIGLSHATLTPTADTPVQVDSRIGSNVPIKSFFSDNAAYAVRKNSNECLELRVAYTVTLAETGYVVTDDVGEYNESFATTAGETITLIAPIGKRISAATVTPASGSVTVDTGNYRTRTFTMPACDVTISATVEDFVPLRVAARAATCTKEGAIEHWEDSSGGVTRYYDTEDCLTEVERSAVYIAPEGHVYNANNVCTRCGKNKYAVASWSDLQELLAENEDFSAWLIDNITAGDGDTTLIVPEGETVMLDLKGYVIDRGLSRTSASAQGSVFIVGAGAELIVNDTGRGTPGMITGGNSTVNGGGVCVTTDGVFTLNGGTILGNKAASQGGGVYVNGGTFTMNGGSIIENEASTQGSGVYVASNSTFIISGDVKIKDNVSDDVYMDNDTLITIADELSDNASVGVICPVGSFTSGLDGKGNANVFFSDDPEYRVRANGAGEAEFYSVASVSDRTLSLTGTAGGYSVVINGVKYEHDNDKELTVKEGDTVLLVARDNYWFKSCTVSASNDDSVTSNTDQLDYRRYSFVMPAYDAVVHAVATYFSVEYYPAVENTCLVDGNDEYWRVETGSLTPGEEYYYYNSEKCRNADKIDGVPVRQAPGEHTVVIDPEVAPTCTAVGHTAGSHCSVCGEVIVAQEEIPATDHTIVIDAAEEPTCTTVGHTAGSHCSICGKVFNPPEEIPATGHVPVTDPAEEPTCTAVGYTEGSHCSVCGEVIVAQTVVPALGHNYENGVCTRCGKNKYDVTSWAELQALFDEDDDFSARLLNNITAADGETTLTVPENKTIILNLNGFTIDRGLASA